MGRRKRKGEKLRTTVSIQTKCELSKKNYKMQSGDAGRCTNIIKDKVRSIGVLTEKNYAQLVKKKRRKVKNNCINTNKM